MRRSGSVVAVGLGATFLMACAYLVSTDGLAGGGAATDDGSVPDADATDSPDAEPSGLPSCAGGGPGAEQCGAGVSCCESKMVPGGGFNRVNNASYPAYVSQFRLDVFEVTVGRFRKFVDAGFGTQAKPPASGSGAHPKIPGTGWDPAFNTQLSVDKAALIAALKCPIMNNVSATWLDSASAQDTLPIGCVDWFSAFAFCIWDGGRLPTDAEWNFAAAGGAEQRAYPWGGAAVDPSYAVYGCLASGDASCTPADLPPVGSRSPKGDGKWGQADLAGSFVEFMFDFYGPFPVPCSDCANLTPESCDGGAFCARRRARSFNYASSPSYMLTTAQDMNPPLPVHADWGVRCARN